MVFISKIIERIKTKELAIIENQANTITKLQTDLDNYELKYKKTQAKLQKKFDDMRNEKDEIAKELKYAMEHFSPTVKLNEEKLAEWAMRIKHRDQKCDICGSSEKLTAHHLWDKKTHPSLMYQDENGICLCVSCHNEFHAYYKPPSQVSPSMYAKFKNIKGII